MRKHVLTTMPTYLAAVLQDASKSYVAFFCYCAL